MNTRRDRSPHRTRLGGMTSPRAAMPHTHRAPAHHASALAMASATAGAHAQSILHSPVAAPPAAPQVLEVTATAEVEQLRAHVRRHDEDLLENTTALKAMQSALTDVQTVLSLHEREVESLWQVSRKPVETVVVPAPPSPRLGLDPVPVSYSEYADLRQMVLALTDRMDVADARAAATAAAVAVAPAAVEPTPPAYDVLLAQEEVEGRLRRVREDAEVEAERLEGQLAGVREALRITDRHNEAERKELEARTHRATSKVAQQNSAFWAGLTAALTSPNLPAASLGDPTLVNPITAMRDAILSTISVSVNQAVDEVHRAAEERAQLADRHIQDLNAKIRVLESTPIPMPQDRTPEVLDSVDGLRTQVDRKLADMTTRLQSQQLNTVDVDRRLTDQLKSLSEMFMQNDKNMSGVAAAVRDKEGRLGEMFDDVADLRDEMRRKVDEMHGAVSTFQNHCNDVLQRHIADVRECIQHNHTETNTNVRLCNERATTATRGMERLKQQVDEMAAQNKRVQGAMNEIETERKEDFRQLQQMQADAMSRMQQFLTADIHRMQKETSSELQRYEDAAGSLYRTVEELRATQQRTLEECHAQGDEQAKAVSRFNKQMNDISTGLKEQIAQESDRLQQIFRNDTTDLREQTLRLRAEFGERLGGVERRLADGEAGMDVFRARLRSLEVPDGSNNERSLQELKNAVAAHGNRLTALEHQKDDVAKKLRGLGHLCDRVDDITNAMNKVSSDVVRLHGDTDRVKTEMAQVREALQQDMMRLMERVEDRQAQLKELKSGLEGELQRMMDRVQEEQSKRMDVENRISKVMEHMDSRQGKLDDVEQRLSRVVSRVDENMEKVGDLDSKLDREVTVANHSSMAAQKGQAEQLNKLNTALNDVTDKIAVLENFDTYLQNKLDELVASHASEKDSQESAAKEKRELQNVKSRIKELEAELGKVNQHLREGMDSLRIGDLRNEIGVVKQTANTLQGAMDAQRNETKRMLDEHHQMHIHDLQLRLSKVEQKTIELAANS